MAAKYITIAREIKKRIITQQYAANEPLPDQFALAAEFSTSRMTIQQAMRQLIVEGLVYTRQGQGTFIRKNFLQLSQWDLSGSDYFGATKTWEHLGTVTSQVVHFELRFPNEKEQASLMINPDTPIYDFIRLRLLNGEPMSLDATVMPLNLVPGLNKTHLESSVFRYVQETLGAEDNGIIVRELLRGGDRGVLCFTPGFGEGFRLHGFRYAFNHDLNAVYSVCAFCYCVSHGFNVSIHGIIEHQNFCHFASLLVGFSYSGSLRSFKDMTSQPDCKNERHFFDI